jgi:DNA-binding CsgD family transcriptional regulator
MLAEADLRRLSNAALKLYAPDLRAGTWVEHGFDFLMALVPADMVNFGNLDPRKRTMEAATTCNHSDWPKAVDGFSHHMAKYPYYNFDPTVNGGQPFFRSEFISDREFRDTDIYCECFRILATMDHAAIYVPTDDGCLAWFSTERSGRHTYSQRDRLMLALGQQHLVNSRRLALARDSLRDGPTLDASIFARAGLTPREAEVAHLLTEGKSNVEIAQLLHLRVQTVKAHISALFNKTGTGNRLALTLHLIELGRRKTGPQRPLQRFAVRGMR